MLSFWVNASIKFPIIQYWILICAQTSLDSGSKCQNGATSNAHWAAMELGGSESDYKVGQCISF